MSTQRIMSNRFQRNSRCFHQDTAGPVHIPDNDQGIP